MNLQRVYGLTEHAKNEYKRLREDEKRGKTADECIECGSCEPECPQKIEIIRQLKEVATTLG